MRLAAGVSAYLCLCLYGRPVGAVNHHHHHHPQPFVRSERNASLGRNRSSWNGLPSATAVDDIDFTGGKAGYGGTAFNTKWNDRGKTTGDYLPDLRDKPGDNMGKDGYPDPFGDRDDLPPGGTGRPPPRQ